MNKPQMRTYSYVEQQRPVRPLRKYEHSGVLHPVTSDNAKAPAFVGYATVAAHGYSVKVWRNIDRATDGGDVWTLVLTPEGEEQ